MRRRRVGRTQIQSVGVGPMREADLPALRWSTRRASTQSYFHMNGWDARPPEFAEFVPARSPSKPTLRVRAARGTHSMRTREDFAGLPLFGVGSLQSRVIRGTAASIALHGRTPRAEPRVWQDRRANQRAALSSVVLPFCSARSGSPHRFARSAASSRCVLGVFSPARTRLRRACDSRVELATGAARAWRAPDD